MLYTTHANYRSAMTDWRSSPGLLLPWSEMGVFLSEDSRAVKKNAVLTIYGDRTLPVSHRPSY